jgi:hypothetical protein
MQRDASVSSALALGCQPVETALPGERVTRRDLPITQAPQSFLFGIGSFRHGLPPWA